MAGVKWGTEKFSAKHELYQQFKADVARLLTADPNIKPQDAHKALPEHHCFEHKGWAVVWNNVKNKFRKYFISFSCFFFLDIYLMKDFLIFKSCRESY